MTEMDRLVLLSCLTNARMACDSTYLLDQEEKEYSSKLQRLTELLEGLIADPTRKIVIFSEWRRMLDRIEMRLDDLAAEYVRLDGQVPQKKRSELVARFQNDPDCRVLCMTNAGSTGLNLQAANTVINVDLPWNPAVLEQRIARAWRMGQKNPVHVYKLVTGRAHQGITHDRRRTAGDVGIEARTGRRIDQPRQRCGYGRHVQWRGRPETEIGSSPPANRCR